jgi:hypothetical protein
MHSTILEINPDVFDIAATMDKERRHGKIRGPLHGIPFAVKDKYASSFPVLSSGADHVPVLLPKIRCRQLLDRGHCKDVSYLVMPT